MHQLRLLDSREIEIVSGGLEGAGPICPADEWWIPNWFEDAGTIQELPAQNGPYDRYWTNGDIWCLYDDDNNLMGVFREDPNGATVIEFEQTTTITSETPYGNTVQTTGGGYTVTLSKI